MTEHATGDTDLRAYLLAEYEQPFSGWDFSRLAGRRESLRPHDTWDYTATVRRAMGGATALLDMDTGGGEFLATLAPLPPDTVAIEGYPPNVLSRTVSGTP